MKYTKIIIVAILLSSMGGCNKYLDMVPDNVPTLEYAFRMRTTAERYVFTCYSFLPNLGSVQANPAFYGGDEMWAAYTVTYPNIMIAKGEQNINNPYLNYWNGSNGATALWRGISQCNIFLENIDLVPDMDDYEKDQWSAEVKTLKAYYHFFLLRMYGPIPIMKENIPISASGEEVRVSRQPVDEVFDYIIELLDEAAEFLPVSVVDMNSELGRITLPINLSLKAKILVYAASPLFNGNTDYAGYTTRDGRSFFNQTYSKEKWDRAVIATKDAIDLCHEIGFELYEFIPGHEIRNISEDTRVQMNYRGTITERWNSEIIWAHTNSTTRSLQIHITPRAMDASQIGWQEPNGNGGVTMKIASLFYTKNGVPIEEDHTWNYNERFNLRTGEEEEKYEIKEGYTTAEFNFDRESRFYGGLGFDGGIWYGHGRYDDNEPYWFEGKVGQFGGKQSVTWHSVTGYYAKKLSNYTNTSTSRTSYSTTNYPWVLMRLGDLYLLYAEALNEANGPGDEVYEYLNRIRTKAGLPSVQSAWTDFSRIPAKFKTLTGLREIIRQERGIEMAFEGQRFWDLRRWKTAGTELNKPITGWDVDQETADGYYREKVLFQQHFSLKDYFWPIREHDLIVNKNLVQNPGW